MIFPTAVLVSLAASTLAYQVTSPTSSTVWSSTQPNVVSWQRVDTDSLNFTIVLVNQNRNTMPQNDQVLDAFVDGTSGQINVYPPSAGFPIGSGFQVNLVENQQNVNTIYAQSQDFNIKQGPEGTAPLSISGGVTVSSPSASGSNSGGATITIPGSESGTASPTSTTTNATVYTTALATSNGPSLLAGRTRLMGGFVTLGFLLF